MLIRTLRRVLSLRSSLPGPNVTVVHLWSHGSEVIKELGQLLGHGDNTAELQAACKCTMDIYAQEIFEASRDHTGHFNVSCTSLTQLEEFSFQEMARQMEGHTPNLWKLLGTLLDARNVYKHGSRHDNDGDQIMGTKGHESNDEDVY